MASYDIAVWLRSENVWPEITLIVQAGTASDAMIAVLHARRVRRAVKVAASAGDGFIHRWYGVTRLADGFDYQRSTSLLMGWPEEQQALAPRREENVHAP
jgi:hypothetical protein